MQIFADNLGFFSIHMKKLLYKIAGSTCREQILIAFAIGTYPINRYFFGYKGELFHVSLRYEHA